MSGKVKKALSARHGRACPGHPRLADYPYGRRLCLHSDQPAEWHPLCWGDQRSCSPAVRTSLGVRRWLYQAIWIETAGLFRAIRRHPRCHPTRTQHQALVPRLEGPEDFGHESGLGRPLRYDRNLKTWMAGTSPAMTRLRVVNPSPQRLQFARQCVGPLRDVAGPQADNEVAGTGEAVNYLGEFARIRQRDHLAMAVGAQACDKMVAIDALDRRLACWIDLGDHDRIGVVEAGAELLKQRLQAGETVRLNHGDDLAVGGFTRRFKDGRDLNGVMAVIVDHGDAVPLPGPGEATLDATESCNRLADRLVGHAEFMRHRDRRRRIRRVMPARHRQHDV